MAAPLDTINRTSLRAFGNDVTELLMELINHLGVRYRFTTNGAILLYGPDQEAQPFRVSPSRNSQQSEKFILDWAAKELRGGLVQAQGKRLAAVLNDPVEHPAKEKKEQPVTQAPAKKAVPTPPTRVTVTTGGMPEFEVDEHGQRAPAGDPAEETLYPYQNRSLWGSVAEGWTQHKASDDREINWETREQDGHRVYRCLICKAEGNQYVVSDVYATGGHNRTSHRDKTMWSKEARAKTTVARQRNRHLKETVTAAAKMLFEAIGEEMPTGDDKRVKELEQAVRDLTAERDAAIKDKDEAVARLSLIKEAFGA